MLAEILCVIIVACPGGIEAAGLGYLMTLIVFGVPGDMSSTTSMHEIGTPQHCLAMDMYSFVSDKEEDVLFLNVRTIWHADLACKSHTCTANACIHFSSSPLPCGHVCHPSLAPTS